MSGSPGDDDVALELIATQGVVGVGRVIETGDRATALAGRTVLVGAVDACGECEVCRRGGAPVCPLARHRTAPAAARWTAKGRWLVPLDDGLADLPLPAAAAIPGDLAVAYTLYARTGVAAREPVVLAGASAVTRLLVLVLRQKGITPIVVADPAATAWLAWLTAAGAVVAPGTHADAVRPTIVDAFAQQGLGARPWRLFATTPAGAVIAAALAGPRATLTVLAPAGTAVTLPGDLLAREVLTIGVAAAHPDLVVECAALCAKGDIDLAANTSPTPTDDHRSVVAAA